MEHLKDLLQRDKFRAFYLYAVSLIHSMRWRGTERGGKQGVGQEYDFKALHFKTFFLAWREQTCPEEASSTIPLVAWGRYPLTNPCLSWQQKSPSPVPCASFTLCSTNSEGGCTMNCSDLWRSREGKDTEHLIAQQHKATQTIGWDIMEAGWEGTLCKGTSVFRKTLNATRPDPWTSLPGSSRGTLQPLGKLWCPKSKWELCLYHILCPAPDSPPSCVLSYWQRLVFLSYTKESVFSCQPVHLNIQLPCQIPNISSLWEIPSALCFVLLKWG